MDTSVLNEIGLTEAEKKIYLALLEFSSAKAGALIGTTGLQNSVVHLTLGKLVKKGLVSFVRKGKIRYYQAADPRNLVQLVEDRRKRIENLLPFLMAKRDPFEHQEAEVFEGLTGLQVMLYELIEDTDPEDEYLFFAFTCDYEETEKKVYEFYREFSELRISRGLTIKGIAKKELKQRFIDRSWPHEKILFVDFPTIRNASVCGNKVVFTPWDQREVSFLITSQQLATNLSEYFYSIWDNYYKG